MKHATLSTFLLVAFGFMPAFGMLDGGSAYFGRSDSDIQQSSSDADATGTKTTANGVAGQKTAANDRMAPCKYADGSACNGYGVQPAK